MYVPGHPCVDAGAGDGQGNAAVDVDGVYGELGAVPQVLRVPELLQIVAEVLEKVVAGANGDDGHGGVVVADDAVGHLVDGAVAAAGVEPQLLAAVTHPPGDLRGVALLLRQDALDVQIVLCPQRIRHIVYLLAAVRLARSGIDDENVLHLGLPPRAKQKFKNSLALYHDGRKESEQIEN